ncbi:MAG: hemolysin family protein [Candidatus Limivivens sp.]|nr:hemolysin family protein [Candidatus Limivivens sp.]
MDDNGSPLLGLGIFLVILVLEAVINCFLSSMRFLDEEDMQALEGRKSHKRILFFQENLVLYSAELQYMTLFLSMAAGLVPARYLFDAFRSAMGQHFLTGSLLHIVAWVLAFLIAVSLLFALGVYLPRVLGAQKPVLFAQRLGGIAWALERICHPFCAVLMGLVNLPLKLLGMDPAQIEDDVTEEEIISMVNEGHEQGVLEASEAEMINNIFEFGDKDAQDIMTHRKNIVAVDGCQNLITVLNFMLDASHSRFPVFEEEIDNVTGILHLKDAMRCHTKGIYDDWLIKDIPGLIRTAVFIPETRNISQLFRSMQAQKLQMVMVADEYGQTAGLVAMEDILEEIVGNIQDEYDNDENMIEKISDSCYIMNGMTALEDVEETLQTTLHVDADIETLNGYLISKLDKIPDEDEHSAIEEDGYCFQILSVANKTIEKVRVTRLERASEEADQEKN